MLRFLTDENFDDRIVHALLDQEPALDIVRARDVGLAATDDRDLLEWATDERRVLLTHDVNTMSDFAFERVRTGRPLAGVVLVRKTATRARIVEDLVMIAVIGTEADVVGQVLNVPLRA
jgi:predicted nuclease of predicted toxin-antitoxin system